MTERKEKPDTHRSLAFLHQFAGNIVNRSDVIGVYCMPQAKRVREKSCPKQEWFVVKSEHGPHPSADIYYAQQCVNPY
jgi:hypothetical protein